LPLVLGELVLLASWCVVPW